MGCLKVNGRLLFPVKSLDQYAKINYSFYVILAKYVYFLEGL